MKVRRESAVAQFRKQPQIGDDEGVHAAFARKPLGQVCDDEQLLGRVRRRVEGYFRH